MKKACLVGTNAPGPINLTLDIMSGPRTAKIPPKKTSINVADATTVSWKIFKNVGNFKLSRFSSFYRRMAQLYQQTKLQIVVGVRWQIRHHL